MGAVLLGAMAGGLGAIIALFLGVGLWPAFMTYVVTGLATTTGVAVAVLLRPEAEALPVARPAGDTMQQWLDDPETRPEDGDEAKVA